MQNEKTKRNPGDGQKCAVEAAPPTLPPQIRNYPISDIPPAIQQLAAELAVMIPELAKDGAINNSILLGLKIHEAALQCEQTKPNDRVFAEEVAMKLAAISTVACGDTNGIIGRGNPYWSAAYDDARQLREDYEALKHNVEVIVDEIIGVIFSDYKQDIQQRKVQHMCSRLKEYAAARFNRQTHGCFQEAQQAVPAGVPNLCGVRSSRRCDQLRMVPSEVTILHAIQLIEELEAHPWLTDAQVLLGKAKDKLGDWVDMKLEQDKKQNPNQETKCTTHPKI